MSLNENICPICKKDINLGEAVIICPSCGIPHHANCWDINNGCSTFGCSQQGMAKQSSTEKLTEEKSNEKNVENNASKTKIILISLGILVAAVALHIFSVIIALGLAIGVASNKQSPMEKLVDNCFQELKEIKGDSITPITAAVFKYTNSEGNEEYNVLIVYKKNGFERYGAFDDDGRYMGDGNTYDGTLDSLDTDFVAISDDFMIARMKLALLAYIEDIKDDKYSVNFVSEKEAAQLDECAVLVSVDKIK